MNEAQTQQSLSILSLPGVGPSTLRKVTEINGFENLQVEDLKSIDKKIEKALTDKNAWPDAQKKSDAAIKNANLLGAKIISELDKDYPINLKNAPSRPFFLSYLGTLRSDDKHISVIGTRFPTNHGKIITERITKHFASNGWGIVSGLALGCDSHAHEAALHANAYTVAVLAHGLHTIAPASSRGLADRILASGGVLLTEFIFNEEPEPRNFVIRDATQAGLSKGVVMIQSDIKGGSLHASRAAIKYNRILASPSPTKLDISNKEEKIQANLILGSKENQKISDLLKINNFNEQLIFNISSKDDYDILEDKLNSLN